MKLNLQGKRNYRLLAIKVVGRTNQNGIRWKCRCDCGGTTTVTASEFKRIKSCGCLRSELAKKNQPYALECWTKHGLSATREAKAWYAARNRCYNKKHPRYGDWGGRGIRMCRRWKNSVVLFCEDMGLCPLGLTLERIDNNGNYEPGNCKWATQAEQSKNKRRSGRRSMKRFQTERKKPLLLD